MRRPLNFIVRPPEVAVIDQLRAVAIATRFLVTHAPEHEFREVWAVLREGRWWVSFGLVSPSNVVVSLGGVCVAVDADTGRPDWYETL